MDLPPEATSDNARVRQQQVVAEMGQQALETDDLDRLLHDAAVAVAETLDNEYAEFLELLPGGEEALLRQGAGWSDEVVSSETVPTDPDTQAGYVLSTEQPVVVDDFATEERFSGPELLTTRGVASCISVAVGSPEEPWGVLGTHATEHREFTDHDVNFVQSVANVLAAAIDRAEKDRRLREREMQLDVATEAASIGLWTWDIQDDVVTADEFLAETYGIDPETAAAGAPMEAFYEPIHEDDTERTWAALQEAVDETGELSAEFRVRDANGDLTWVVSRGEVEYDEAGEPVRLNGAVADITERKRREQALEESEERYRNLFTSITDAYCVIEKIDTPPGEPVDFRYVEANPAFEEHTGIADVVGETLGDVVQEPQEWIEVYDSVVQTGDAVRFERELVAQERVLECHAFPVGDRRDEQVGVIFRDVTERKRNERKLEESERRYRTLAEHFPNGVVGVYDHDLRYTLAAGEKIGDPVPSAEEVEGTRMPELYPDDAVEDLEPLFRAAVEDGETGSVQTEVVGREWQVWAMPLRNADDEIFAGLSFAQDITEQVEHERELERALDLLEKTERIADVAGWEVDPETMDVFWSDNLFELLDVSYEEQPTLDQALDVYYTDEDRRIVEDAVEEAVETGDSFDVQARFPRPSGDVGWLRVQGDPDVVDDDVASVRGAVQDVTEQKERERELEATVDRLEASNERLEQFAYAASHDLQEPLRMVSSYLQLIERRYGDCLDEDGEEFLEYAIDGADRMREMIEGLLQYSRVETQGNPLEPVDLNAALDDVLEDLQLQTEESGAEITVEALPRVQGDGSQLRQLFQNLLENAIRYSGDEPPRVHVTAERDGTEWLVSVSDEGEGIEPEYADRVFEVFERLHSDDDHSGAGIGLALCERIVERHGGEISVDSTDGRGTTFTVSLPAVRL